MPTNPGYAKRGTATPIGAELDFSVYTREPTQSWTGAMAIFKLVVETDDFLRQFDRWLDDHDGLERPFLVVLSRGFHETRRYIELFSNDCRKICFVVYDVQQGYRRLRTMFEGPFETPDHANGPTAHAARELPYDNLKYLGYIGIAPDFSKTPPPRASP